MEPVAWGWPLAMLSAGLAIGLVVLWRMRPGPAEAAPAAPPVPVELRDLDGRLDALIGQLRELDDLASTRSAEQLARERYALELEAASAWRERDQGAARLAPAKKAKGQAAGAVDAPPAPAAGFLASRPGLRGFVWGVGTAGSIGALVFVVWQQARPREQGGSATGTVPAMGRGAAPAPDDETAQFQAALAQNPDDVDLRLDLAQLHLRQRDLMGVWNETQYVLERHPGQPRALAYQALVRLAMNQPDVAVSMLKQAMAADPNLIEVHLHLALVYMRTGREKDAQAVIDQAAKRFPEQAQMLARVMTEMRAVGRDEPSDADPHAGIPAPGEAGAPAAAAAAPESAPPAAEGGPGLAGVIELPEALRSRVSPNALVFVTVRDEAADGGPPVAVKRLPATSFPLRFTLDASDSMMGQPLPARARVEARVDSDGNPLTRVATDPSARLDGVTAGSTRLRLVLQ
jgi:tetratricopeptide (TPR) repeat protein